MKGLYFYHDDLNIFVCLDTNKLFIETGVNIVYRGRVFHIYKLLKRANEIRC